jgi:hypothetical protein
MITKRIVERVNNANLSSTTKLIVNNSIRMLNGSPSDKLEFATKITRPVTFTNRNGEKVSAGIAEALVDNYLDNKQRKADGKGEVFVKTRNKMERAFESFLPLVDKHGIFDSSRGTGSTSTSNT